MTPECGRFRHGRIILGASSRFPFEDHRRHAQTGMPSQEAAHQRLNGAVAARAICGHGFEAYAEGAVRPRLGWCRT
jgi:hypothetical protein